MCDTMGIVDCYAKGPYPALQGGVVDFASGAFFAKNSDRSPNEAQALEWRPAADHRPGVKLRVTYTELEQVPHTYGALISRPLWLWGAEMGVNEKGLCIGNEAVFTRGPYGKTGLTGMDLLRLALERSASAAEALDCITSLLERHGQGGDCGYDHRFFYDNSFLILDRTAMYILETAGKAWAARRVERGSISNRLCLDSADSYGGVQRGTGFARAHREPVYSFFSGSARRQKLSGACVAAASGIADLIRGLRIHKDDGAAAGPLTRPGVDSPCMHAGGLIGDHTTASLAVELGDETVTVWATGSSTPCVSLFKPWRLGNPPAGPVAAAGGNEAGAYWKRREAFHRRLIGLTLPPSYYEERDALEAAWLAAADPGAAAMASLSRKAAEEEEEFFLRWQDKLPSMRRGSKRFLRYWEQKTRELARPARAPFPT